MGPIWGVAMNVKNQWLLWDPIWGYCNEWKTNDYYGTLYASITMNVKNQWLLRDPICEYCTECK